MGQSNDLNLSLSGEAFSSLRSDFDQVLRSALKGMIDTNQNTGEIGVKVKISLKDDSAPDYTAAGANQTREVTKPRFEHTITSVIQYKEKKTGSFDGEYELVFDSETGAYVARPIENGQTTLFGGHVPTAAHGDVIDAEYTVVQDERPTLGGGPRALLESSGESESRVEKEQEEDAAGNDDEAENAELDPAYDPTKPFGWLRQFIGEAMHVTEAMGNFTVRTDSNKVVLSSATSLDNPFYCDKEKLEPHTGHNVVCVGYGNDETVNISIECEDCSGVLFSIDAPGYKWTRQDSSGDDERAGEYEYEEPEE